MKRAGYLSWTLIFLLILTACEKEITVDLPRAEEQLVVEGNIYNNQSPLILLTRTQGYFDPTDLSTLSNIFVHDASVKIRIRGEAGEFDLPELCVDDLTDEQLAAAAVFLGIPIDQLRGFNLCVYTNPLLLGEAGKIYDLEIRSGSKTLTSSTRIEPIIPLDSVWFRVTGNLPTDSLGLIYGILDDPDTLGNCYRWYAKRINQYKAWVPQSSLIGQQKDPAYIAPLGSVFDDSFFNGLQFQFAYFRGSEPNSSKFDDSGALAGFFVKGDTVAIRGCTIDRGVFNFYRSYENQVVNQGSPFALPANVQSNIQGGLGVWAGFGAIYDTVICR